jgi:hypothetical protein
MTPQACMLLLFAYGCFEDPAVQPHNKSVQAEKAEREASTIRFDENAEIDNIKARLELTSSPGLLGYIVLLNGAGQPVMYTTVKGKVTSGSKRLTKPYDFARRDVGQYYADVLVDAPSDEGTYGRSGDYIYFWTENGQYVQWSGTYLYSDKPIRLSIEPIVVNLTP